MADSKLIETVASLILQSVSVWEDMHLYAMTFSTEYISFWDCLDDTLRLAVTKTRNKNRIERIVPFSIDHLSSYKMLLTPENYQKLTNQHWKRQLKIMLSDLRFRTVLMNITLELQHAHKPTPRPAAQRQTVTDGVLRITTGVICANAATIYNHVR